MNEHSAEKDAHDHDEFDRTCERCVTNVFLPTVRIVPPGSSES